MLCLQQFFLYRSKFNGIFFCVCLSLLDIVSYTGLMLPKSKDDLRVREQRDNETKCRENYHYNPNGFCVKIPNQHNQ